MRTIECDVVVVGAGPAGSMTAKWAALGGADVMMIEKRPEIGSPIRCGEGISRSWLDRVGITVDPKWVARKVKGAKIVSPSRKYHVMLDESKAGNEVGFVVDRVFFDKALARDAAVAGARIMLKTAATSLIMEDGKIAGVRAVSHGEPVEIRAGCVVGADGFESQVGRWAGIDTSLKPTDIITCYQYRMTNIDYDPDFTEFLLGSIAPGGYAWIFPKDENTANVGLGVLLTRLKKPGEVKEYLDRWIANDPRLKNGQPLEAVSGAVSVCAPLDSVTMDNLLLVGDAARMINPITGGGIANSCYAGMFAGKVLAKAAKAKDFSQSMLQEYEDDWRAKMENGLWRDWMAKEKLITLPDETLEMLVEAVSKVDLERITVQTLLAAVKETYPELVKEFEDLI
ncbi:MAG: NAD(P)/FAD-dependent oxidoreductase [Methanomassiliicoccaceae archaeon]|jgi:digeranylgeranylglycerophospholipid reductase|nr:NAD(P)/FAD-dependent oxidoreductase [Euryarchaeota archaeon]HQA22013.1 NAD(P)/FAD-dependent oxidoreductase [Methanomassiliicoccaceae archaeon]HQD88774.1 NAD(P)/FAD-dependent oxidoreductase [Methanomassiliicoccaceae archaeon]